ncbi:MAG: aminotransferase class III-fold pyridoxal phosphate-dependent enzyme [Polyangiales bacterium]
MIAFEGGYHGLAYGPLSICGYSDAFRQPFAKQLNPDVWFLPWPKSNCGTQRFAQRRCDRLVEVRRNRRRTDPSARRRSSSAINMIAELSERCKTRNTLDHRQKSLRASEEPALGLAPATIPVSPISFVGKSLGGGLPISACVGTVEAMRGWGDPDHEAIHTGTFFGNPLTAATAIATLEILEQESLISRSERVGGAFRQKLQQALSHVDVEVRGEGFLIGIDLRRDGAALPLVRRLLEQGFLCLPSGSNASVLQISPPLTIPTELLDGFVESLRHAMKHTLDS